VLVDPSDALLAWWDANRRDLPWRAAAGMRPDPYRVWLSEIMLQQTTVATVRPRFAAFLARWPTVEALAAAPEAEVMSAWAGLGYYARARNLIACARKVAEEHGGRFPAAEAALRDLPGVGAYTAAAITAIAFNQRAVVVDTNVERVVARLFALEAPLPAVRPEIRRLADTLTPHRRCGDFAQAMMDLGATVCTPRSPDCGSCPLAPGCAARATGVPETFPRKAPRRTRPGRRGNAYWLEHDGQVLLVRRPGKGLLGGMLALPSGSWSEASPPVADEAPIATKWSEVGTIEHVFTHFTLRLDVFAARSANATADGIWWPIDKLGEAGLPTVFAKAAARGSAWSEGS
jgi:A/G-specific adenine glycosylase